MRGSLALLPLFAGCVSWPWSGDDPVARTAVSMDFDGAGFYDAPFPSDHRLDTDGTVMLGAYPNEDDIPIVAQTVAILDGAADGFSLTAGVFLRLTGPLDPDTLPDLHASVLPDASVQLLSLEDGTRIPVRVGFAEDAGPFGDRNLLSAIPLQGLPLAARTTYALVVTTDVFDADGLPLARWTGTDAPEAYTDALYAVAEHGVSPTQVAGLAVFTTGDPADDLALYVDDANASFSPQPEEAWVQTDLFDEFCVYRTAVRMPVYQSGDPPYLDGGGGFTLDDPQVPAMDHMEDARLFVTVPRATMPIDGWPASVMIRTGGGGDRVLVDRGTRDADGDPLEPGTGPALFYARAGYAGVQVDGPHGGLRNVTGGDEQFLIFNIGNPVALRDNIRQSALELTLVPDMLDLIEIDVSDCPGAGDTAVFDTSTLVLMGHSMGATIAPLVLAYEPRYGAAILSGAGGSYIENIVYKESPIAVRPIAENMLDYGSRELTIHDPFLSLLQWAGEPSDPPVYAPSARANGAHVLMFQGIVDTYILPPIANATSLSLSLDAAGDLLDAEHPDLQQFTPLADLIAYGGGSEIDLPAQGNADGLTAVVVQHGEDGVEDGHEVMYQVQGPKHQYRCFLETLRTGTPIVPIAGSLDAPCE